MTIRRALAGATAGTMLALAPATAALAADGGSASSSGSASASASVAEETAAPSSGSASASASVAEESPASGSSSGSASEAEAETEETEEGAVPEGAPDTGVGGTEEGTNGALLASGLGVIVAGAALGAVALRRSRRA